MKKKKTSRIKTAAKQKMGLGLGIRTLRFLSRISHSRLFRESLGILLISIAVFLVIGFATFGFEDNAVYSRCGKLGTEAVRLLVVNLGIVSGFFPVILTVQGVIFFRHRQFNSKFMRSGAFLIFLTATSAVSSLLWKADLTWNNFSFKSGGNLGTVILNPLKKLLGPTGSGVFLITIVLISILGFSGVSYHSLLQTVSRLMCRKFGQLSAWLIKILKSWRKRHLAIRAMKKERKALADMQKYQQLMQDQSDFSRNQPDSFETDESECDDDEGLMTITPISKPVIQVIDPYRSVMDDEALSGQSAGSERQSAIRISGDPVTRPLEYELPDVSLLDDPPDGMEKESHSELLNKSEILLSKLREFSIEGRITEVCPGPVITRYEFEPAPGIKISKIVGLSDDLALGMRSRFGLRVSPIPGKSTIGVEIPNQNRETVYLKEILLSDEFQKAKKNSILSLPLGKDTAGRPFITDLKRMPHLLIAGATGSGKSVCINTILAGLLFIARPEQLRLLLIDPKMLELSDFNGIPHLREPVITEAKMTPDALNWAVSEMEQRYRLLAAAGVRNIDQYNAKVANDTSENVLTPLPYLVIVIDELADLMLTAAAAIEDAIQRLAQMARAAGIHLIIATQRPSVDVITGVIKANLPCRLAFQVASKVDSRTILDGMGAEKLIGMGDCIFIPPGTSQHVRAHGAYVSESEIKKLVLHLSNQPVNDSNEESIFAISTLTTGDLDEIDDPMYNDAVRLVLTSGVASISMLQRRLKVGHSRASRLIDCMELSGIVGPHIGSKTREILVDPDEYLDRLNEIEETDAYE